MYNIYSIIQNNTEAPQLKLYTQY